MALKYRGILFICSGLVACGGKETPRDQGNAGQSQAGSAAQAGTSNAPIGGQSSTSTAGKSQIGNTGGTSAVSLSGLGGTSTGSSSTSTLGGTSAAQTTTTSAPTGTGGMVSVSTGGSIGSTGGTSATQAGSSNVHTGGNTAPTGGMSAVGGGGSASLGGTAAGTGGTSSAGASAGTTPAIGGAAGTGGTHAKTDATDAIGQDPFTRSPDDGILITSSDGLNSTALVIAADAHDNLLVAGATENPAAMGLTAFDSGVVSEAFAAKLDPQGKLLWSVPLKTCGVPARIAAGPDDAAFVLCPNEPDATTLMPSTCDATALVTKLAASDGHVLFQTAVAPDSAPADAYWCPYALAVDAKGNSYVGGGYAAVFPTEQAVVIGLSSGGQQQWSWVSDGPSDPSIGASAYAEALAVDTNGHVLACGSFNNWMTLGSTKITSQSFIDQWSSYNGFVAQMSDTGTDATGYVFGGTVFDLGMAIKPASTGGYYLGGMLSSSATVAGKSSAANSGGSAFVALIDANGKASWVKNTSSVSVTRDLAADASGKVYIVGTFADRELYYVYDPSKDTLSSHSTISGSNTANGLITQSIAITPSGAVWLTGNFSGTIDLGGGLLTTSTVSAFLWKAN